MNANKKNVTTVCPVLKMSTGKKEGSLPAISHECGNSMQFECKEGPIYILLYTLLCIKVQSEEVVTARTKKGSTLLCWYFIQFLFLVAMWQYLKNNMTSSTLKDSLFRQLV